MESSLVLEEPFHVAVGLLSPTGLVPCMFCMYTYIMVYVFKRTCSGFSMHVLRVSLRLPNIAFSLGGLVALLLITLKSVVGMIVVIVICSFFLVR